MEHVNRKGSDLSATTFFIAICRERLERHHYEKVFRSNVVCISRVQVGKRISSHAPTLFTTQVLLILSRYLKTVTCVTRSRTSHDVRALNWE
nr:MAG TPA: hypothetical protein [Bacteriophage sp.]